jgi:hypothetical protein
VIKQMGKELAEEVVRVHSTVVTDTHPRLKIVHRDVPLDTQNEDSKRAARLHMIFFDDTVIATVGGELLVQIALQFKRRSLFPHTMVFGLTDGKRHNTYDNDSNEQRHDHLLMRSRYTATVGLPSMDIDEPSIPRQDRLPT